jgi:hypothetical protein
LDILSEIKAVLRVETTLIALSSVFVEDISEAERIKKGRRRKSEEYLSICRLAQVARDFYVS